LEDGHLITDLYRKPTDTLQYLDFRSCHPLCHKLPIAYSQALRIVKICSKRSDAIRHCSDLKEALIKRGYPRGPVERRIRKALGTERSVLLFPDLSARNSELDGTEEPTPISMLLPYHPSLAHVQDIIRTYQGLLEGHNIKVKVFWKPPRTIRGYLVSSYLRPIGVERPIARNLGGGMRRCGRPRCLTCQSVNSDPLATSSRTGLSYRLPASNCTSKNVVYLLNFDNCKAQYIGQTKNALSLRINQHRSAANKLIVSQPVPHHMKQHGHKWENVNVTVLDTASSQQELDRAEFFWISQMMTDYPFSLNIQHVLYRNCFSMDQISDVD
jgi:hypothetical protein